MGCCYYVIQETAEIEGARNGKEMEVLKLGFLLENFENFLAWFELLQLFSSSNVYFFLKFIKVLSKAMGCLFSYYLLEKIF